MKYLTRFLIQRKNSRAAKQTTMRALVEEGLRRVLSDSRAKAKPAFKLKDARVHGKEMLISDPGSWQQAEEEHVISRVMKQRA